MSEHTPGPWTTHKSPYRDELVMTIPIHGPTQGVARHSPIIVLSDPEDRDANIQLISAAPDLLEACKAALDDIRAEQGESAHHYPVPLLEAAIAKATATEGEVGR